MNAEPEQHPESQPAAAAQSPSNDDKRLSPVRTPPSGVISPAESTPRTSQGSTRPSLDGTVRDDDDDAAQAEQDLAVVSRASSGPAYTVFSTRMIYWIVAMNCVSAFISPTTANIYFPALPSIANDLGVSIGQANLSLTTYMIFQALAPTIFGDLADAAGRRPAFIIAMVIYLGANIGLALQRNFAALLVLRMIQSGGSSGTIALVYGVVADIAPSSERGRYMGIVGAGITVGPSIGPVIGGLLTQYLGWPSVFWFCVIVSVLFLVPYILAVPETGRKIVGNGSIPPQGWNMTLLDYIRFRRLPVNESRPTQAKRKFPIPNPFNTLRVLGNKDMALVLGYNALIYVGFMTCTATLSTQFADIYHYNNIQLGLCYLPVGVACMTSSITQGFILDWNFRRTAKKLGIKIDRKRGNNLRDFPIERVRIQLVSPLLLVGAAVYIAYGWVLQAELHVAAPLVLSFFIGLCVTGSFQIINTLIVDLYPEAPATATAANNFVRCLAGAVSTAVIEILIGAWGRGWAYTFIALLFLLPSPILWVIQKNGPKWREERRLRSLARAERKEQKELEKNQQSERDMSPDNGLRT
ncbi:Itaconate transport protein [Apiospora kogelbergensis]|uniref:Itaconate transport protein n=1 Tax=Apiospora kogelbergensis TaxID=1337665 RepID=UPI00312F4D9A